MNLEKLQVKVITIYWANSLKKETGFIYLFWERGERREKEREKNINWLPLMGPQPGTRPVTQACALTGNWTSSLCVIFDFFKTLAYFPRSFIMFVLIFLIIIKYIDVAKKLIAENIVK